MAFYDTVHVTECVFHKAETNIRYLDMCLNHNYADLLTQDPQCYTGGAGSLRAERADGKMHQPCKTNLFKSLMF